MKERLTGAIILVALLVLLVPELLTGPSRSAPSTTTQAPPNLDGAAQMRSYTINLSDDPNAQHAGAPPVTETPGSTLDPQNAASAGPGGSASVEAPSTSASEATRPRESATTPAATEGRQSASRADAGSRSGVSADAPAAANAARSTRPNADVGTHVESSPAARAGSAEPPAGKGWAVQVGSFASRENAEKLTRQLKGKGFAATVSESSGKGGKRLWRVRVGPEADRAAAVALGARLRSAGLSGGAVVPYP